ncbi:MAG: hypothetical protein GY701_11025 [Sulfitobacter sp.]|nr:hypothetical protein [Sulfitobacter sp.]
MVDADPIRMFLHRWMIETGDPIDVVARGFGVDAKLLEHITDRRTSVLSAHSAAELYEQLGVDECRSNTADTTLSTTAGLSAGCPSMPRLRRQFARADRRAP